MRVHERNGGLPEDLADPAAQCRPSRVFLSVVSWQAREVGEGQLAQQIARVVAWAFWGPWCYVQGLVPSGNPTGPYEKNRGPYKFQTAHAGIPGLTQSANACETVKSNQPPLF